MGWIIWLFVLLFLFVPLRDHIGQQNDLNLQFDDRLRSLEEASAPPSRGKVWDAYPLVAALGTDVAGIDIIQENGKVSHRTIGPSEPIPTDLRYKEWESVALAGGSSGGITSVIVWRNDDGSFHCGWGA